SHWSTSKTPSYTKSVSWQHHRPSVGTIICYCASFWLLAQTLAYIPTGIAYAIWSGVGIVLISLLSWGFFGQRLDLPAIIGMMLICAGVLVINLLSRSAPH
ncbi:EmrE family multidrug efflux SMR transporter, partial [Escherichia coli]